MITLDNYKDLVWTDENVSGKDYSKFFKSLAYPEQLEFLKFLLKNYPEYDPIWVQHFFDIADALESKKEKALLVDFNAFLREECPEIYKKEFNYLEQLPVSMMIFNEDLENLKLHFAASVNNPIEAIDDTLRYGFNLLSINRKFWDYTKSVAQQVWEPLRDADNLIGVPQFDYSLFLYCDYLEQAFAKINKGETVDWEVFTDDVVAIEFKYLEAFKSLPETDYDIDWETFHSDKKYRSQNYMPLLWHALYSIHIDFGIPVYWVFRTGMDIREYMLDYDTNPNRENWFAFTPTMIDRFGGNLNGFLSGNRTAMMIELFTLPYFYDYFLKMNFIDQNLYDDLMLKYDFTRRVILEIPRNNLWEYAGIYDWQKPNFISQERFEKEKELAHNSFDWNKEEAENNIENFINSLPELPKSVEPEPSKPSVPMFDMFGSSSSSRNTLSRDTSKPKKQRKKKPKNNRKAGKKGNKRK